MIQIECRQIQYLWFTYQSQIVSEDAQFLCFDYHIWFGKIKDKWSWYYKFLFLDQGKVQVNYFYMHDIEYFHKVNMGF